MREGKIDLRKVIKELEKKSKTGPQIYREMSDAKVETAVKYFDARFVSLDDVREVLGE